MIAGVVALFIFFAVGALLMGLSVVLTPPLAQKASARVLSRHVADLGSADTDALNPPRFAFRPDAITLETIQEGSQGWDRDFIQTFTAPVLAVLRARENTNLDAMRGYVVPSASSWLAERPEIFAGKYQVFFKMEATVSEFQVAEISVTGDHLTETWTLVRRRIPITCRSCGGSVSGSANAKCRTCHTPCTGFEGGWRVLEIEPGLARRPHRGDFRP
jgi:hypothetical protein